MRSAKQGLLSAHGQVLAALTMAEPGVTAAQIAAKVSLSRRQWDTSYKWLREHGYVQKNGNSNYKVKQWGLAWAVRNLLLSEIEVEYAKHRATHP